MKTILRWELGRICRHYMGVSASEFCTIVALYRKCRTYKLYHQRVNLSIIYLFICVSFKDILRISRYITSNIRMTKEWNSYDSITVYISPEKINSFNHECKNVERKCTCSTIYQDISYNIKLWSIYSVPFHFLYTNINKENPEENKGISHIFILRP
jgi:hypothetical protein